MDFSETVTASDLKVGRSRHIIKFITVCEFEGQGHFLILAKGRVHTKIQTGLCHKLLCRSDSNFV